MLTLILGRAKTGKTTALLEAVRNSTAVGMSRRILIVPEQLSHQTERRLSAVCGDRIGFDSEVLSFTRLENRVSSLYGGCAVSALDAAGRILTARLALSQIVQQLRVYAASAMKPEFLGEIVGLIDEMKTCGITPAMLREAELHADGTLAEKLRELSTVLSAYNAAVAQGEADPRDKLDRLAAKLQSYPYADDRDFFVDGFSDFTAQEFEILQLLMCKSRNMTVAILCDHLDSDDELFLAGRDTALRLLAVAKKHGIKTQITYASYKRSCAPDLLHAEKALFAPILLPYGEAATSICLKEAESVLEECRCCAAFLKQQAMEGRRFRDMFVCAGNSQLYQPMISQVFSELGLPVYLSGKRQTVSFPCVAFVLLALETAAGGFRSESVLAYLKTGFAGVSPDEADLLENYALIWNIRGSKWHAEWTMHPDGYGAHQSEQSTRKLTKLNAIRNQAMKPLKQLDIGLKRAETVRQQAEAMYRFMLDTQLYEQLSARVKAEEQAGRQEQAQELTQVWSVLIQALQQIVAVLGSTHETTADFLRILKLSLQQYEVGTIPAVLDSITFGSVSDMRGYQPHVLCVLGANEGMLPSGEESGGLLSDYERTLLKTDCELQLGPDQETRLSRQLLQIYSAFTAPDEKLYVSWHAAENGSATQPSFLVRRLMKLYQRTAYTAAPELALTPETAAQQYYALAEAEGGEAARRVLLEAGTTVPLLQKRIAEAAGSVLTRACSVSSAGILNLFGDTLRLSATKLDSFAACPLQFFLRFGLSARERRAAEFNAVEFGIFVHSMLEKTVPEISARKPVGGISDEALSGMLHAGMKAYRAELLGAEAMSNRESYLFERNYGETLRILQEVRSELMASDFIPNAFELKFGGSENEPIPVAGCLGMAYLEGTVDRADIWRTDRGSYLRIVDYKSGNKSFDYTDLYYGSGMQLLVYLFQLESAGLPAAPGPLLPAAALYEPAQSGMEAVKMPGMDERKPQKRTGLVLADESVLEAMENGGTDRFLPVSRGKKSLGSFAVAPEQFSQLRSFVQRKMAGAIDRILSGAFEAAPYYRGSSHSACTNCAYRDVCQKDAGFETAFYRETLKADEFWHKIGDETHE